jgi:hypothetical protein
MVVNRLRPSRFKPYADGSEVDATSMFACGVIISEDMVVVVSAFAIVSACTENEKLELTCRSHSTVHTTYMDTHLRWDW